jgi:hypothetical protein
MTKTCVVARQRLHRNKLRVTHLVSRGNLAVEDAGQLGKTLCTDLSKSAKRVYVLVWCFQSDQCYALSTSNSYEHTVGMFNEALQLMS